MNPPSIFNGKDHSLHIDFYPLFLCNQKTCRVYGKGEKREGCLQRIIPAVHEGVKHILICKKYLQI